MTTTDQVGRTASDGAELRQAAADLVPELRARGGLGDELRRLPEETVADLRRINVVGTAVPTSHGGLGLEISDAYRAAAEIGRGDGSTAWIAGNTALHALFLGYFDKSCQDEVWGSSGPTPFVANGFTMHRASCERAAGGFRVSGRWDFATAIMHSDWYIVAAVADDGPRNFVVRRGDYEVVETWDTIGLRGTGSHDVVMKDVFVPDTHSILLSDMFAGTTPGGHLQESPYFRVPTVLFGPGAAVATLIGLGRAAVELFEERCRSVAGGNSGIFGAERPDMAIRTASAAASIDASAGLFWADMAEMRAIAEAGDEFRPADRMRFRRNHVHVSETVSRAVAHLYEASGATALTNGSPLSRVFRDATAASHHYMLSPDTVYLAAGRLAFGLDPQYALY